MQWLTGGDLLVVAALPMSGSKLSVLHILCGLRKADV